MRNPHLKKLAHWVLAGASALTLAGSASAGLLAFPQSHTTVALLRDGDSYLGIDFLGWGPRWQSLAFQGTSTTTEGVTHMGGMARMKGSGAEVTIAADVAAVKPRQLRLAIDVSSSLDIPLTYIVAALDIPAAVFSNRTIAVRHANGTTNNVDLPLARQGLGPQVTGFTLTDGRGAQTTITIEPPCDVTSDGAARIILAGDRLAEFAPRKVILTLNLPEDVTYYADTRQVPNDPGFDQWWPFTPTPDFSKPSEISLADWIEAPAGKHGRITRQGEQLIYTGQPIKLWGLNLTYSTCAPEHALAEKRAAFYRKYGINSVRLHKFADGPGWAGIQSKDSAAEFDPAALDRMDYQVAKFKEAGIYVELSAHFGTLSLGPADSRDVPYLKEFGRFENNRVKTPASSFHYSPELQNVQIRQITNLLAHRNPYTGLTYAEDPAISAIEIINEQSILFFTSLLPLKQSASIRRYAAKRFSDWLGKKYGTQAALVKSWGKAAFDSFAPEVVVTDGEQIDKGNIVPVGNPWFWDPEQLAGSQAFRRQRLLDTLQFLYELQCEANQRYVRAVRQAGYTGEILGSNWQAGRAYSHYANLQSDARVGLIDRHNYFGGGGAGKIDDASTLAVPGAGLLSAGMEQVADRPFMMSEWIHVAPTEWGVEGPAIIGAYGLGLQGWDASYLFQNRDTGGFSDRIGREPYDVTAPQIMGVFPAVARQVLRGDVREATVVAPRYVHVPSLFEGRLGFQDEVKQTYDVKSFDTDRVPAAALAVARTVVAFTETNQPTPAFDLTPFRTPEGAYVSCNQQLRWYPGASRKDGHFTMDTPATKAVVGFAQDRVCELSEVTITPATRFAAIYVTAKATNATVATAKELLVVAIARARNTGMKVLDDSHLLSPGTAPIVMEPVKARIALRRAGTPTVTLLDHDGSRTEKTLPVRAGAFEIDGARDRTCYYLVSYP